MSTGAPDTFRGQLREYCGPFCGNSWTQKILILAGFALFLIFMQILNSAGVDVYVLGIVPRTAKGLAGLIGAPWVHVDWKHLVGNLIGWFSLGLLVLFHGRRPFGLLYAWLSVVGGFAVWVVARPVTHVGLSGVIFGFFGFLLFAAIWQRPIRMKTIIGLVIAIFLYGGTMISGVLIPNFNVSWESHICGFIAGVIWALLYFKVLLNNQRFLELMGKESLGDTQQGNTEGLPTTTPVLGNPMPSTTPAAPVVHAPRPYSSAPAQRAAEAGPPWWKFGGSSKDPGAAYRAGPKTSTPASSSVPNPTFGGSALPPAPLVPTEHANPYAGNSYESSENPTSGSNPFRNS